MMHIRHQNMTTIINFYQPGSNIDWDLQFKRPDKRLHLSLDCGFASLDKLYLKIHIAGVMDPLHRFIPPHHHRSAQTLMPLYESMESRL